MESALVPGQIWGRVALDWAELQEPVAMLDVAAVRMGTRVLAAACSAGGASVLAVRCHAHVNGMDAADGLLAIARHRVPSAHHQRRSALRNGSRCLDSVRRHQDFGRRP